MLDNNNNNLKKKYDMNASLLKLKFFDAKSQSFNNIHTQIRITSCKNSLSAKLPFFWGGDTRTLIGATHRTVRCIPLFKFFASRAHNLHRQVVMQDIGDICARLSDIALTGFRTHLHIVLEGTYLQLLLALCEEFRVL